MRAHNVSIKCDVTLELYFMNLTLISDFGISMILEISIRISGMVYEISQQLVTLAHVAKSTGLLKI